MNSSDRRMTLWGLMYGVGSWAVFQVSQNLVGQQFGNLDDTERLIVAALLPIALLYYLLRREEKGGGQAH
jgi:hypothetical protein